MGSEGISRILIYGNSGSGKTTMARRLATDLGLARLSLDDIAWEMHDDQPRRRVLDACESDIKVFMQRHPGWVIDGCYGDLVRLALPACTELRFLNPGIEACLENCRRRPWEPDKYTSPEAQSAMLETLMNWVREYGERDDDCSEKDHRKLFEAFGGNKKEYGDLGEY